MAAIVHVVQKNPAWSDVQAVQTVHEIASHACVQNAAKMVVIAHAVRKTHVRHGASKSVIGEALNLRETVSKLFGMI